MIIIGGGSAGLFLAAKSAGQLKVQSRLREKSDEGKSYDKITVIEEHKKLGLPVQCTGILTDDIYNLIDKKHLKKFTLNEITRTRIFSPRSHVDLKIKPNIIIDNTKFIEYLADIAKKNKDCKVNILTNHRYLSNSGREIKVKNLDTGKIKIFKDLILIGADGPSSKVAAINNLNKNREYVLGIQARIKLKNSQENRIDFYPYIGEYAWAVPEGNGISRVGIAVPLKTHIDNAEASADKNSKEKSVLKDRLFDDFLKKYPGKKLEVQAGLIPLHKPGAKICSRQKNFSVALVGDAAGQIKNTTGGGIIPGLKAANELSEGISIYQSNLKKLNRELYLHYLLNKSLRNYNDNDWDRLVNKVKNENVQQMLETINRDNAAKLLFSLAAKKGMLSEGLIALRKLL